LDFALVLFMMGAVDTALMLYCCQQMETVMISFRIDIARENDERMAYDRIDNLMCIANIHVTR
jgi:hypothetical protein